MILVRKVLELLSAGEEFEYKETLVPNINYNSYIPGFIVSYKINNAEIYATYFSNGWISHIVETYANNLEKEIDYYYNLDGTINKEKSFYWYNHKRVSKAEFYLNLIEIL